MLAAPIKDPDIGKALANLVKNGGVLIWMAGDKAPAWLTDALGGNEPPPEWFCGN
jgi:hypothetical protein